jgi:rubrerythrin
MMNIFDCALKMEVGARMNYEKLAETTRNAELKELFTILAEAEQEHHNALEALKKSSDPAKAEFRALKEAACVFHSLVGKRDLMDELDEDTDMYQQVVKEEEDAIRFYEELAAQADDKVTGEILLKIAAEERRHLSIVENIYAFVESPKNFLAWGEFSNLKEY